MFEGVFSRLQEDVTRVIIDEAGMVPESQLLALCARLPNLKQVFIMKQLPPYRALVRLFDEHLPHAPVVILCFYSGTKRVLELALKDRKCTVHTIDQFQGQAAQIVIPVTTRDFSGDEPNRNLDFFLDPARITVALSRAKDGLVAVGNFDLLISSNEWYRFVKAATQ
ncbi:unnamed protein product [Gongylonema pulchrum]|uniref:AAA_12 domain-containing protein n=1 Tax=Gongylonema pulchrum TaxID=637853 RepID=A0A183DUC6_9BILA|nr:unnamed protein product [Gongylonema pulchrum]